MLIPDLRADFDKIELDHVTLLVKEMQEKFIDYYGEDFDIELWDVVRIREEFSSIFTPKGFNLLYQTQFGKGVIIGSWLSKFIMKEGEEEE